MSCWPYSPRWPYRPKQTTRSSCHTTRSEPVLKTRINQQRIRQRQVEPRQLRWLQRQRQGKPQELWRFRPGQAGLVRLS
jgi:hypothetical protein